MHDEIDEDLRRRVIDGWEQEHSGPYDDRGHFPLFAGVLFESDRFILDNFWSSDEGTQVTCGEMEVQEGVQEFISRHSSRFPYESGMMLDGHLETIVAALVESAPSGTPLAGPRSRRYRRRM